MKLFRKKGRKYQEANEGEIMLRALEIMESHPRLKGTAEFLKLELMFGRVAFREERQGGSGADLPG